MSSPVPSQVLLDPKPNQNQSKIKIQVQLGLGFWGDTIIIFGLGFDNCVKIPMDLYYLLLYVLVKKLLQHCHEKFLTKSTKLVIN